MGKPESIIENYLIKTAKKHNYITYKFQALGQTGVPDRILIGNGRTLFIECKAQNKKVIPNSKQDLMIKNMISHGADVRIVNSKKQIDDIFQESIKKSFPPEFINSYNTKYIDNTLENSIETTFVNLAKINNFLCFKFKALGQTGVPDRILIGHNTVYFVELKAPGKNLRKLQKIITDKMRYHGAIVIVINTKHDCINFFNYFKYNNNK